MHSVLALSYNMHRYAGCCQAQIPRLESIHDQKTDSSPSTRRSSAVFFFFKSNPLAGYRSYFFLLLRLYLSVCPSHPKYQKSLCAF